MELSRRKFLARVSMLSAIPLLGIDHELLNFKTASVKFGYSTITWGNNFEKAIHEIAALGFTGVQLRNPFEVYAGNTEVLKKLVQEAKLDLVMASSGNANINTGNDEAEIAKHVANAKFIKAVGGNRIQVTNGSRPANGVVVKEDLVKYGKMLTEIGKRTAAIGVETTWHNHMAQLGQTPEEVETILQTTDPKYVGFLLDVAHYLQGGGDPAKAIIQYQKRIKMLHLKDVKNTNEGNKYQFVELGQGRLDFPAVFKSLDTIRYHGYAVIELDGVPVKGRTELESGQIAKDYLNNKLGFKIQ